MNQIRLSFDSEISQNLAKVSRNNPAIFALACIQLNNRSMNHVHLYRKYSTLNRVYLEESSNSRKLHWLWIEQKIIACHYEDRLDSDYQILSSTFLSLFSCIQEESFYCFMTLIALPLGGQKKTHFCMNLFSRPSAVILHFCSCLLASRREIPH